MLSKNNNKENNKVALGLSGGVDSSVAAYLLKERGYEVIGVYIQCWDEKADGCKADEDRVSAVKVASHLGIKFVHLKYIEEYKKRVIDYFYGEYEKGRTPNPDIMCNQEIKFGLFLDWALEKGFNFVSTGHYASVEEKDGKYLLKKGEDEGKDQSYFLYRLNQHQLSKSLFPLGDLKKAEVREIAEKAKLPTYNRPDSQGICFIGEVDIREFLQKRLKPKVGKVLFTDGSVVGKHEGVWFFTIGQRHGFKVDKYFGLPLYVVGKNVEKNELIVGYSGDAVSDLFEVDETHWISGSEPEKFASSGELQCDTRIRHLGVCHKSKIVKLAKGTRVELEDEIFGVAPGQSAVFYDGDITLGGGIIL